MTLLRCRFGCVRDVYGGWALWLTRVVIVRGILLFIFVCFRYRRKDVRRGWGVIGVVIGGAVDGDARAVKEACGMPVRCLLVFACRPFNQCVCSITELEAVWLAVLRRHVVDSVHCRWCQGEFRQLVASNDRTCVQAEKTICAA